MDPYLERHWLDVHARLVMYAADSLNESLPQSLVARTEERVAVGIDDDLLMDPVYRPDVIMSERGAAERSAAAVAYEAPLKLMVDVDPITERFIRILGAEDEQLVTVIEVVSPTNKVGEGLKQYRQKRAELIAGGVNVVELDLVRRGDWRALMRPHVCGSQHWTEYRATVRLEGDAQSASVHPAPLQRPLPAFAIPLRKDDPEVRLDLQNLVDLAYSRGRYGQTLNYAKPLDIPLSPPDDAWARELLAKWRNP